MEGVSCCGTAAIVGGIGLLVCTPAGWRRIVTGVMVFTAISAGLVLLGAQAPAGTPRGAHVITGLVRAADGQPVPDVFVTALLRDDRIELIRGPGSDDRPYRFVDARLGAVTDASGRYSLDLPYVGEFYLVAIPRQVRGQSRREGYGNTFYPAAARFLEAKPIRVRPGEVHTADVTLTPARLASVSGTVLDSVGKPATGRLVMTHGDGFFGLNTMGGTIRPDGRFTIPNLQPGTYFLTFREGPWPPPRGTIPVLSQTKVVVAGDDLADVAVKPITPVRATGRITVEGPGSGESAVGLRIHAFPTPVDGNPGPVSAGTVRADLTFDLRAWPMPSRIRVDSESGWMVTLVRLNGRELPRGIILFDTLGSVEGLEVVLVRSRPVVR